MFLHFLSLHCSRVNQYKPVVKLINHTLILIFPLDTKYVSREASHKDFPFGLYIIFQQSWSLPYREVHQL